MKILIIGAGKMGAWLVDSLCLDHEVAVYDTQIEKLKYLFNVRRLINCDEIKEFQPELLINAVSLQYTIKAFNAVLKYIPQNCILSDIASVKDGLRKYYEKSNRRFVSTHPMFGPTFGDVKRLSQESAIIINESDEEGKAFFRDFYSSLGLTIYDYTFENHDKTIAYSLSIPFSSSMVFAACMKKQDAPGTTFKRHMEIAKGLFSEDDFLLSEILFNPYTLEQVEDIHSKLSELIGIIKSRNSEEMHGFFKRLRENIE